MSSASRPSPSSIKGQLQTELQQVIESAKTLAKPRKLNALLEKFGKKAEDPMGPLHHLEALAARVQRSNPDTVYRPVFEMTLLEFLEDPSLSSDKDKVRLVKEHVINRLKNIETELEKEISRAKNKAKFVEPLNKEKSVMFSKTQQASEELADMLQAARLRIIQAADDAVALVMGFELRDLGRAHNLQVLQLLDQTKIGMDIWTQWATKNPATLQTRVEYLAKTFLDRSEKLR